jgi:hypothetical protein
MGGRCLGGGGATVQLSKQGIPSFGQKLSGHEFSEIYKASAFRLFVPPLKNSAENEDLPSVWFPVTSVVAGVEKPGATGGRRLGGWGEEFSYQSKESLLFVKS